MLRDLFFASSLLLGTLPIFLEAGTLIVSYQTGPQQERLDRVRFRVVNEKNEGRLFPKGDHFVNDAGTHHRLVAVEDLVPGRYTVEFLVPNGDGLFEEVPPRIVEISEADPVRIDQLIRPRWSSLVVIAVPSAAAQPFAVYPSIKLMDKIGKLYRESQHGKLTAEELLPGYYVVCFEELAGYRAPSSLEVKVEPGSSLGPITAVYESVNETEDDSLDLKDAPDWGSHCPPHTC